MQIMSLFQCKTTRQLNDEAFTPGLCRLNTSFRVLEDLVDLVHFSIDSLDLLFLLAQHHSSVGANLLRLDGRPQTPIESVVDLIVETAAPFHCHLLAQRVLVTAVL